MGKGKTLHPADAFRKEQKKKDAKRNAKTKANIKEVNDLLSNPQKIQEEIERVQKESDANRLDKGLKERIKELKMMKGVALKKQQVKEALSGGSKRGPEADGHAPSASASAAPMPPVSRRPDESIYYHPQFNPTGAAPPGQPMLYRTAQPLAAHPAAGPPGSRPVYAQPPMPYPSAPRPRGPPPVAAPPRVAPVVGGMNGVPLPPPRVAPVVGGMNGVPLPPPRPMGMPPALLAAHSQPPPPFPYATGPMQPHPSVHVNRRPHAAPREAVDPLDPAASGYNARSDYGGQRQRPPPPAPPAAPAQEPPQEQGPMLPASVKPVQCDIAGPSLPPPSAADSDTNEQGALSAEELMRRRFMMPDEEEGNDEDQYDDEPEAGPSMPGPESFQQGALSAEELMKRRFMMPDEEEEDNQRGQEEYSGPAMAAPSIEEIMRRRGQVVDVDEEVVGPAGPPIPDDAGPDVGPQRPPTGDWSYYPTAEEVYGTASPLPEQLDCGNGYTAPTVAPAVVKPPASALQLFSAYGDSDDDSDQSDEETQPPLAVSSTVPQPSASLPMYTIHSTVYQGSVSSSAGAYPDNLGGILTTDGSTTIAELSVPAPPAPKPLPGPKIVKIDSELTGFVPAAIRVKRQMGAGSKGAAPLKKSKLSVEHSNVSNEPDGDSSKASWVAPFTTTAVVASKPLGPAAVATSVDSEYSDFMKEIEALNALES